MRRKLFLTIAVAALLTSCRRHEAMLTGGYGGQVVAGQVVMASEMGTSSPAGVEVSVVGTGMSAILAGDGRFTFAGVPANAELAFRRADGIDARMTVSSSSAPLVVELAGKTATDHGGGRRRGVSPSDPSQQIEGVIKTAGTDSIVVVDSHQQTVTVALDSSTLIRKGNAIIKAADLKVGDHVHISAVMKDNKLTALQVIVEDAEGDNGKQVEVEGAVASINGTSLLVHGITVNTDANTVIRKQGQTIAFSDIKTGDTVSAVGTRVDAMTMLAKQIEVHVDDHQQQVEVEGTVASISGTSLVVHGITVNTDSSTVITERGQTIAFGAIKTGDTVSVEGIRVDATTILAKHIEVHAQEQQLVEVEGTVTSIHGTSLVVHWITVNTDANTVISKQGQPIAFGDLKIGDTVSAVGTRVDATTMLAKLIEVHSGDHHN